MSQREDGGVQKRGAARVRRARVRKRGANEKFYYFNLRSGGKKVIRWSMK